MKIIGIDIGGANTKIVSSDEKIIESHYIPLWKNTTLPTFLKDVSDRLKPDKISVVITGELADCFENKYDGVQFIKDAVDGAFDCEIYYVTTAGEFFKNGDNLNQLAAANWAASTKIIGNEFRDCIFIDIGGTTTDIIPIVNGLHVAEKTDFLRLLRNELIYMGTLRTNIATIIDTVKLSKGNCRVSSELFSITADVYVLLGCINKNLYSCETPDGFGVDKKDVMRRIARVVCADLTEIDYNDILEIAKQVKIKQISILKNAIQIIANKHKLNKIVGVGIGDFLIEAAAFELGIEYESMFKRYGAISNAFPAYAAAKMLELNLCED